MTTENVSNLAGTIDALEGAIVNADHNQGMLEKVSKPYVERLRALGLERRKEERSTVRFGEQMFGLVRSLLKRLPSADNPQHEQLLALLEEWRSEIVLQNLQTPIHEATVALLEFLDALRKGEVSHLNASMAMKTINNFVTALTKDLAYSPPVTEEKA